MGKVSRQPNQLENVSDFRCLQPINVVEYHYNRFIEIRKSFFELAALTTNTFFPMLKELACDFRCTAKSIKPCTDNRQPSY